MYHPAASKLGVDRKAVSAISRPRPAIKSGKALKCYTLNVNNKSVQHVVSMDAALLTNSKRPTAMRDAADGEAPWQFVSWLEAGIVSAAFRVQGGTEYRSLQAQHKALVSHEGRPRHSIQPSLATTLLDTTQWMADIAFERSAMALSWHMLSEVNGVNEEPGLALENLHSSLQELAYEVLQSRGCATAWATPIHRPLPAAAAGLVPGTTGNITLPQCLELDGHTPAVCFEHQDGSWDGNCTIYLPRYQLIPVTELGKALNLERLMQYLGNCSRTKSLSELLLLQLYKGLLAVGPQAMLAVQNNKQQQQRQLADTSIAAMAAVVDNTNCSTHSCASGGGIGCRGSRTAVGADDDDGMAANSLLVPAGLNRQKRDRPALLVSPLVTGSSMVGSGRSSGSKVGGKQGVLLRLGSALKRLCLRSPRA